MTHPARPPHTHGIEVADLRADLFRATRASSSLFSSSSLLLLRALGSGAFRTGEAIMKGISGGRTQVPSFLASYTRMHTCTQVPSLFFCPAHTHASMHPGALIIRVLHTHASSTQVPSSLASCTHIRRETGVAG